MRWWVNIVISRFFLSLGESFLSFGSFLPTEFADSYMETGFRYERGRLARSDSRHPSAADQKSRRLWRPVLRTFALKQYLPDAGTPFSSLAKGTFEREQGEPTVSASRENLPYTSQSIRAARKGKSIKIDLFRDPSYRGRGKSGIMPGRRRNWQLVRAICLFVATVMVLTIGLGKSGGSGCWQSYSVQRKRCVVLVSGSAIGG
jgi:hypothetical protein